MCGITGFFGRGGPGDLDAMTQALVHRGPDGAGAYHDPDHRVFLGHRRLAIIDVAGGVQPMWDADGQVCIVYNGEIYNHAALRRDLERRGRVFRTSHSDTEVLIQGYLEWGRELPTHLNGMFAFCIYDRRACTLFLARDRFGEKPLYYAQQAGTFLFASELSAIAAHGCFSTRLARRSVQKFFAYGFIPAPHAIFEDCAKLPGGCTMEFDIAAQTVRVDRYWRFGLEPDPSWLERPEDELVEELRALLFQAVERRLIADTPVGFFLSGGLDSSAVLAAAGRFLPRDQLRAFTLGFSEASFDESGPAKEVAEALGAIHALEQVDLETARACTLDILARLDEPSGDASVLPTALLAQFTRREVKVALSGDGADELFAGYDPFSALVPARLYQAFVPRPLHVLLREAVRRLPASDRNMSLDFKLQKTLSGLSHRPALWNPVWLAPVDPEFMRDIMHEPLTSEELYSEAISLWEANATGNLVDRTLDFYTNLYLQDGILNKVDRATMMFSLESRAVFLDNDIVTFCQKLPSQLKLRGGRRKHLLKRALEGLVPPEVIRRRKKGFGMPTAKWLRSLPESPPLAAVAGVRMSRVAKAWGDHRTGAADHRQFLWSWLSLQSFASGFLGQ